MDMMVKSIPVSDTVLETVIRLLLEPNVMVNKDVLDVKELYVRLQIPHHQFNHPLKLLGTHNVRI